MFAPRPVGKMNERRATLLWLAVALAVFGGFALHSKLRAPPPPAAPSWQRPVSELTAEQRRFHTRLLEQLRAAEKERGETKQWPPSPGWELRSQGLFVNYVQEAAGLRWLVLFIEPDPRAAAEKPPPDDAEHHTLGDGTPIHVTVWTQPQREPKTGLVTAFPAAEGWVERVLR